MPPTRSVLVLHNLMAPYRFPLFRALARQPGIDLTVWFMSHSARNRRWQVHEPDLGFRYRVLPGLQYSHVSSDLFTYIFNYTFPLDYARARVDTLVCSGWLDFATQAGFVMSKALGRKFILWSESTAFEPSWRRTLAAPLVTAMVRGSDAYLPIGTRARDYLLSLGADPGRVSIAYSTVDVAHFTRVSAAAHPNRAALRAALAIDQPLVVLYCGQLIERKGLSDLMEAFGQLRRGGVDAALVLVGYGPLREALLHQAVRLDIGRAVHILDHVEVEDMPRLYALADVFVLPSLEDTWGLVVNEAMACGLPVIVSERAGCSADLVAEGENGFVIPAHDPVTLADRLRMVLTDERVRQRYGACSAARIERFTPELAAAAFVEAIERAGRQ